MNRILTFVFFLAFSSIAQVVYPVDLSRKVDSLSQALKDAQLAASYSEKTLEATYKANEIQKNQFEWFVGGLISLFGISSAVFGFWVFKKTAEERQAIAIQVKELVSPMLTTEIGKHKSQLDDVEKSLRRLNGDYNQYAGKVDREISNLQNSEANIKPILEHLKQIDDDIRGIKYDQMFYEYQINMDRIESYIRSRSYSHALEDIIRGIQAHPENVKFKAFHYNYCQKLSQVLLSAKRIFPESKKKIEAVLPLISELNKEGIVSLLEKIPVYEKPTTVTEMLEPINDVI